MENEWKGCLVHNVIRKPGYIARDGFAVTLVYFYRFRVWFTQSICLDYVAGRHACMLRSFFRKIIPRIMPPIFMLTGFAIILDSIFPSSYLANDLSITFRFHILIAMLSYSCLVFTSVRALTIHFQENSLRNPKTRTPT